MPDASEPDRGSVAYVCLLAGVAALGGLLFGYDTAVIAGAIGFVQTHFRLDPQVWTGWAAASALLGCAVGAGLAGPLNDHLGRKKTLILAAVLFLVSALGTAFPRTLAEFVVYRILGGLAVGAASLTSPVYIAEVSPAKIRGRMVSVNQLAIVTGMLVVYFVNYFINGYGQSLDKAALEELGSRDTIAWDRSLAAEVLDHLAPWLDQDKRGAFLERTETPDGDAVAGFLKDNGLPVGELVVDLTAREATSWNVERGWRWMFGSEALPAALLLVLMLCVPESPRWLAKQARREEALAVLTRVGGPEHALAELAEIDAAIAQESGSLRQLLEPGLRAVLLFGVVLAVLQQVTGINVFLYYATEIFKSMGSGVDVSLLLTVLVGAVNLSFTVVAIWTVDRLGRKPLMLVGYAGMGLSLLAVGLAAYFQQTAVWVLVFILSYIACFALSVGPVTWVILSEVFPTRIRGRAMAIATVCLWMANYVVTQTFTVMKESQYLVEKFHYAFPYWVYAVLCGVAVVFVWRFLPETKGKTLEEIERGWLRQQ
jgi:SP family xylose:H+ symportor-like MFS transporter